MKKKKLGRDAAAVAKHSHKGAGQSTASSSDCVHTEFDCERYCISKFAVSKTPSSGSVVSCASLDLVESAAERGENGHRDVE